MGLYSVSAVKVNVSCTNTYCSVCQPWGCVPMYDRLEFKWSCLKCLVFFFNQKTKTKKLSVQLTVLTLQENLKERNQSIHIFYCVCAPLLQQTVSVVYTSIYTNTEKANGAESATVRTVVSHQCTDDGGGEEGVLIQYMAWNMLCRLSV